MVGESLSIVGRLRDNDDRRSKNQGLALSRAILDLLSSISTCNQKLDPTLVCCRE